MTNRVKLLEQLIRFEGSLPKALESLSQYGWDSKVALIKLSRQEIVSVLEGYLRASLTASDVEQWANVIEGREDIGYESKHENLILSVIHELANPLITRSLNRQTARELINKLK